MLLPTLIFSVLVFQCSARRFHFETPDEVHGLPGLTAKLNFSQYSGYLQGVDPDNRLHYWFVESQNDPKNDPLILWMNGGPGCSSLGGMLSENGPFFIQEDGRTLKMNPYSWNTRANVMYLEAPVGVGFSYNRKSSSVPTGDDQSAKDNYAAVKNFFEKYPQFSKNKFFIMGESYGGVYVPMLTKLIVEGEAKINLKGFAVGNGLLDDDMNDLSVAFYYYHHGFIDHATLSKVTRACCSGSFDMRDCQNINSECRYQLMTLAAQVGPDNPYNVYQKCPNPLGENTKFRMRGLTSVQTLGSEEIIGLSSCMNPKIYAKYLNQPSVRKAIHIDQQAQEWVLCQPIPYQSQYATMRYVVKTILRSARGLFYNGDFDTVCNFVGDEWFAATLGLPVVHPKQYFLMNKLTAGYKTVYQNLTFTTVKGAGHMVPMDQPETILKIITAFINDKNF